MLKHQEIGQKEKLIFVALYIQFKVSWVVCRRAFPLPRHTRTHRRGSHGSGVDSGTILRYFGSGVKVCEKADPGPESLFTFGSSRSLDVLYESHSLIANIAFSCIHSVISSKMLERHQVPVFEFYMHLTPPGIERPMLPLSWLQKCYFIFPL